ncbi:MAG: PaaI family thioesterase [Ilumatobacteraceae bacterium]
MIRLRRARHRLAGVTAGPLARWDTNGVWRSDGSRSAAGRLSRDAMTSMTTAHVELHRARTPAAMPNAAAVVVVVVLPLPVGDGDPVEFDPFSGGGGRLHPASVGIDVRRDGDTAVVAVLRVDPMFQGPPGRVHGGVLATVIDELMGTVNRLIGQRAYTARLAIDYRAPAPIDTELTFRAWLHDRQGRKLTMRAEGRADADVVVEAEALFIVPRPPPSSGPPVSTPPT